MKAVFAGNYVCIYGVKVNANFHTHRHAITLNCVGVAYYHAYRIWICIAMGLNSPG
jgi:hypothetical protein